MLDERHCEFAVILEILEFSTCLRDIFFVMESTHVRVISVY